MAVTLYNLEFFDEFTALPGGGIGFLAGSIGDKITAYLTFDIAWSTEDVPMTFDLATSTITRNDIVTFTIPTTPAKTGNFTSFKTDGFKVGDTFDVVGSASNDGSYTIASITDKVITTVEALTDETDTSCSIYGTTEVTSIDYFFNLIENDSPENYISLVDNKNTCRYNYHPVDTAMGADFMLPVGRSRGWEAGEAQISGVAYPYAPTYTQRYTIVHQFFITPLFLAAWYSNIQDGSNPSGTYKDLESLKYICKIEAKYNYLQTTPSHTSVFGGGMFSGNVGFYDEFVNGFDPNYILKSVSFVDVLTSAAVDNLQYGRSTTVDIRLTSNSGVFAAGCKVALAQCYAPLDTRDYIDTTTDLIDNFRFDRVLLTEGAGAVQGEQFATDNSCIIDAQAVLISASELQVTYTCTLSTAYSAQMAAKDQFNRNYLLFCTPQNLAVTDTDNFDRNAVLCHTANYTTDNRNLSLWGPFCFVKIVYGFLYNWFAVDDVRLISSGVNGYDVPANTDFVALSTYLGGNAVSGGKLKEKGYLHWLTPNTGATDEVGFNARGGGARTGASVFENIKLNFRLWTSTSFNATNAYEYYITYDNINIFTPNRVKKQGASVRLFRSATVTEQLLDDGAIISTDYTGNDGQLYNGVKIGTQVWLTENLIETLYRNGDPIPEVTNAVTWAALSTGARCSYDNDVDNAHTCNYLRFENYPNRDSHTSFKGYANDLVIATHYFQVESKIDAAMTSLAAKIVASKVGYTDIILDEYTFDTSAFPLNEDLVQEIDIERATNLDVRADNGFETITIERASDYDYDDYVIYKMTLPFKVRYETWVALISKAFPTGTMDWASYELAGWAINFNIYASVRDNNTDFTTDFIHVSDMEVEDFDTATTAMTCEIKTYDASGATELDGLVLSTENTVVEATFTMADTSVPAGFLGWYGVITLDNSEIGGIYFGKYASSQEAAETDGIWYTAATLTVVNGTTITVTAVIDYTKLPNLSAGKQPLNYLSFYARLGTYE